MLACHSRRIYSPWNTRGLTCSNPRPASALPRIPWFAMATHPEPDALPADWWTAEDCARFPNVGRSTWTAYVARGQAPQPDRMSGRSPVWRPAAVTAWAESRPRGFQDRARQRLYQRERSRVVVRCRPFAALATQDGLRHERAQLRGPVFQPAWPCVPPGRRRLRQQGSDEKSHGHEQTGDRRDQLCD